MITFLSIETRRAVVETLRVPLDNYVALEQLLIASLADAIPPFLMPAYQLIPNVWVLHRFKSPDDGSNGLIFSDVLNTVGGLLKLGQIGRMWQGDLFDTCYGGDETTNLIGNYQIPTLLLARSSIQIPGIKNESELWGIVSFKLEDELFLQSVVFAIQQYANTRIREFQILNAPYLPILQIE